MTEVIVDRKYCSALDLGVDPMQILQGYEIADRSTLGSMVYLQPKK